MTTRGVRRPLGIAPRAVHRAELAVTAWLLSFVVCLTACGGGGEPLRMGVGGDVTRQHRAPEPDPVVDTTPRAWLWEVRGPESLAPSYLLGTMHLGVTRRRALPPPLDEFLHDARVVVMEIDPRDAERMLAEMAGRGRPPPRREWLDRALPATVWQLLVDELGHLVPSDVLRRMPPALLQRHLVQVRMAEVEAREDGRQPVRGAASTARLDRSIFEWAVAMGRPVIPLETPEQQLEALRSVSRGSAVDALRAVVEEAESARDAQRTLREAYLSFEADRVQALLDAEMPAEDREILLLARNRAWIPELLPQLEEGRAFVAVGLGHLLGQGSVLELLRAQGYEVRRVGGHERPPERTSRR